MSVKYQAATAASFITSDVLTMILIWQDYALRVGFSKNLMTVLGILYDLTPILRRIYNNANFQKILWQSYEQF